MGGNTHHIGPVNAPLQGVNAVWQSDPHVRLASKSPPENADLKFTNGKRPGAVGSAYASSQNLAVVHDAKTTT